MRQEPYRKETSQKCPESRNEARQIDLKSALSLRFRTPLHSSGVVQVMSVAVDDDDGGKRGEFELEERFGSEFRVSHHVRFANLLRQQRSETADGRQIQHTTLGECLRIRAVQLAFADDRTHAGSEERRKITRHGVRRARHIRRRGHRCQ